MPYNPQTRVRRLVTHVRLCGEVLPLEEEMEVG
jgi:hypothetical protein